MNLKRHLHWLRFLEKKHSQQRKCKLIDTDRVSSTCAATAQGSQGKSTVVLLLLAVPQKKYRRVALAEFSALS
jgi:hypothetical protein